MFLGHFRLDTCPVLLLNTRRNQDWVDKIHWGMLNKRQEYQCYLDTVLDCTPSTGFELDRPDIYYKYWTTRASHTQQDKTSTKHSKLFLVHIDYCHKTCNSLVLLIWQNSLVNILDTKIDSQQFVRIQLDTLYMLQSKQDRSCKCLCYIRYKTWMLR